MDILYISAEYPPETGYGGIGTYTKYIAEGMVRRGHTVTVIARSDTADETCTRYGDVEVHRIHPHPHPLPGHRYAFFLRWFCRRIFPHTLTRISWSLAVARRLNVLAGQGRNFDIIEAPECGAEGVFVTHRHCRCFVVRLHTPWEVIRRFDELKEPAGDMLLLPQLERWTAKRADALSAPSKAIVSLMRQRWGITNVSVIPNPLPPMPRRTTTTNTWIYIGRIERRKGIHHLIEAYAAVKKEYAMPTLRLIGRAYGNDYNGTPYGESVRRMINKYDIGGNVIWTDHVGLDDVGKALREATVAFFPSLWENFPYACLEAMSSGCAVVTSDCGGFPEIIVDGESGILVATGSASAIAAAMRRILSSPGFAATLGEAARKRAEKLTDAQLICNDMERFYRTAGGNNAD